MQMKKQSITVYEVKFAVSASNCLYYIRIYFLRSQRISSVKLVELNGHTFTWFIVISNVKKLRYKITTV